MRRYYSVDFLALREFGLTINEWYICQNVEFACHNKPETFYAYSTRAELGEYFGLSEDRMRKIVKSLVDRGFLKKNKKHHLRVSRTWKKVLKLNAQDLSKKTETKSEIAAKAELEAELRGEPNSLADASRHHEEEFGEDEVSIVKKAPSKNEARKEAVSITKLRDTTKELAVVMADSFWYKQEGMGWKRVSNWKPLVRRFVDNWERNEKGTEKIEYKAKEKKIVKPTNIEEMTLFLKQMNDEERKSLTFENKNREVVFINQFGFPMLQESGEACSHTYFEKIMTHFLKNFKNGKLQLKRSKR